MYHALKTIVADAGSPHKLAGRAPDSWLECKYLRVRQPDRRHKREQWLGLG